MYEIRISQSGHDIVTDHSHRLHFEYLYFKPMGIVFHLAKSKMCHLKTAILHAKMKCIKRKQNIAQRL